MRSYLRAMRYLLPSSAFVLLLFSCGPAPQGEEGKTVAQDSVTISAQAIAWPGYYTDTLPCADCPGIETTLWVRSDSTFVLQERYIDRDTIPYGTVGQWHVVNGLLTIGYTGDKPEFYRYTEEGLLNVDEMGEPFDTKADCSLDKLADEINDEVPLMLLIGSYRFQDDTHSFQPCGAKYVWPAAMGYSSAEEEGESLWPVPHLDSDYQKAVKQPGDPWVIEVECLMSMGPAMEGDGADEYVYMTRFVRALDGNRCP